MAEEGKIPFALGMSKACVADLPPRHATCNTTNNHTSYTAYNQQYTLGPEGMGQLQDRGYEKSLPSCVSILKMYEDEKRKKCPLPRLQ
jgi:hypothetical protein